MTAPGDNISVGSVSVEVVADAKRFARTLRREVRDAFKGIGKDLQKTLDRDLGKRGVQIPVSVDDKQAAAAGVKASEVAEKAAPPVKLKTEIDRKQLRKVLSGALTGLKVGGLVAIGLPAIAALVQGLSALLAGLAAATAGLVPVIGNLVNVLVTAAGAAVAIPGAIAVAGVAFATLKVGLAGVGDALKAVTADSAEFEEAIKDLAPNAQEFVRAIRGLRPAFKELRLDVQNALFRSLGVAVGHLANVHMVTLRSRMVAVATSINEGLLVAISNLSTEAAQLDIRSIFSDAANVVANLTKTFGPLVDIMRDVATVGATILDEITRGAGLAVADFAALVAEMRETGQLRQIILDGLDALKLLGSALIDIVGIFRGLFRAAGDSGGGIFAFLDRLNILINSIAGQEALGNLFAELGRIGTALMPVLLALGQGLGVVAKAIGDIAVGSAPFLAEFLTLLGDALASLAPGFIALGPSVVALAKGLVPLAQILSDLVVGAAPGIEAFLLGLGEGLAALAPVARPVGEALGALLKAVGPLLPVLGTALAGSLSAAASALSAFAEAFAPLIEEFARGVLSEMDPETLVALADAGAQLGKSFARLAKELAPLIPFLVDLTVFFLNAPVAGLLILVGVVDQFTRGLQLMAAPFAAAISLFRTLRSIDVGGLVSGIAAAIAGAFTATLSATFGLLGNVAGFFQRLPGQVIAFLLPLPGQVGRVFLDLVNRVLYTVGFGIGRVLRFFIDLPGKVAGAIQSLPVRVGVIIHNAIERARVLVSLGLTAVVRFFAGLPDRARSAVSSLWSRISGAFSSAVSNARTKAGELVNGFINVVRTLPDRARDQAARVRSRIASAFSGAGRWLYNAGRNIIMGLVDGIVGGIGSAIQAGLDAGNAIKEGIKDGLRISSPSKVMRDEVGYWIPAGIAEGIRRNSRAPERELDNLTARFAARWDPLGSLPSGFASAPSPSAPAARTVNVNLTAYSDKFNLRQVLDDLAFQGAV